jgi:hypothetical protein
MRRHLGPILAAALALVSLTTSARADLASLYAAIHGGIAGGRATSGADGVDAFHDGASGGVAGALVGVEVLFIDAWVQHDQYVDGEGIAGTWTQIMAGLDLELELGAPAVGAGPPPKDGEASATAPGYLEVGGAVGFAVGTGQQVDPPLDNSEVTDKGVVAQLSFGAGLRLTDVVTFGVSVPLQYAYLYKNGADVIAEDSFYGESSYAVLGTLRFKLGL